MPGPIHTAPPDAGPSALGKTLPDLLYEAESQYENPRALNQPTGEGWTPMSLRQFRHRSEETALGLRELGLERGEKVALLLESDVHFCVVDMGCLLAGLINVPLYLSSSTDQMKYVLEHAEAETLVVANPERLAQIEELLPDLPQINTVVLCETNSASELPTLPGGVQLVSLESVQERGASAVKDRTDAIEDLRDQIDPDDLATIIYTSGTTGKPKGVMLSHENISSNAITSVGELPEFDTGPDGEVVLSFLPLTHIFARMLQYAYLARGVSIYFAHPDNLIEVFPQVRPTVFASVPRVLEKVYAGIRKRIREMSPPKRALGTWALEVARNYEMGRETSVLYSLKRSIADALVFRKWREALGGRVKYIVVGGAALQPDLAKIFSAAGITALQGYGLTETSPVISYTRPHRNKPGTVGELLPDVEARIAEDGEILTRGPHVMQGYYKDPEKTEEVIDDDGWFHTGDIGEFDQEGFLKITDRKKDLFKLSTGKYVMPQPIENQLGSEPLVDKAVVVGSDRKFCSLLIFPSEEHVRVRAKEFGLDSDQSFEELLAEPEIIEAFRSLVKEANQGLDSWATAKCFALIPDELTADSDLLTPTLKVRRSEVQRVYADEIDALYKEDGATKRTEREAVVAEV